LVEEWWPKFKRKAEVAYDKFHRKYVADADQLESDALDILLLKVRRLPAGLCDARTSNWDYALENKLGQLAKRRFKRLREVQCPVEVVYEDCGGNAEVEQLLEPLKRRLGKWDYALLLRMAYRRADEGETFAAALGTTERWHRWRKRVRPKLVKWLRSKGLLGEEEGDE
jgi:hypothetical protein